MKIPSEVIEYVKDVMSGFENADNMRVAIKGNSVSEKEYELIREKGCCGAMDYQVFPFKIKGQEFYYGFNYGH